MLLLKRYKLIHFVMFNPSFCNYLKNMYILYKKDLRYNFISLPFEYKVELKIPKEHVEIFKSFILTDTYFVKRFSKLMKLFSNWPPKYNGRGSYLKWKSKMMLQNSKKFAQYTRLFIQISDHMFSRFVELGFSVSAFDKILLSLEVELPIRFFVIAAFFRVILYWYHKNEKNILLPNVKTQKVKYKRLSV